jgi:hypothetical protein
MTRFIFAAALLASFSGTVAAVMFALDRPAPCASQVLAGPQALPWLRDMRDQQLAACLIQGDPDVGSVLTGEAR